jgi:hypothetical protein
VHNDVSPSACSPIIAESVVPQDYTPSGTDAIDAWASFLEQNGRKGIITETGGENTDSCVTE